MFSLDWTLFKTALLYCSVPLAVFGYLFNRWRRGGVCPQKILRRSMKGQRVIVTGATSGIGYETARHFYARGAELLLLCRNQKKVLRVIKQIVEELGKTGGSIDYELVDFSDMESVKLCASKVSERWDHCDLLVNNAGLMLSSFQKTKNDFEGLYQINFLSHVLLTHLLLALLKKAKNGRVVNVASRAHYRYSLKQMVPRKDLESDCKKYFKDYSEAKALYILYGHSKLCQVQYSRIAVQNNLYRGVTMVSLHPGVVIGGWFGSNGSAIWDSAPVPGFVISLYKLIAGFGTKTAWEGSQTTLLCSMDPNIKNGQYYSDCALSPMHPLALDDKLCQQQYQDWMDMLKPWLK